MHHLTCLSDNLITNNCLHLCLLDAIFNTLDSVLIITWYIMYYCTNLSVNPLHSLFTLLDSAVEVDWDGVLGACFLPGVSIPQPVIRLFSLCVKILKLKGDEVQKVLKLVMQRKRKLVDIKQHKPAIPP